MLQLQAPALHTVAGTLKTTAAAPLLDSSFDTVLRNDDIRSIIASYLTVPELVLIRGVSSIWLEQFNRSCCWKGSRFKPTNLQLRLAGKEMRVDTLQHLEELTLRHRDSGNSTDRVIEIVIQQLVQRLAACSNLALKKLVVEADVTVDVLKAMPVLRKLHLKRSHRLVAGAVQCLPSTITKLQVDVDGDRDALISTLMHFPLAHLQHCEYLWGSPIQVVQLASVSSSLTSATLSGQYHEITAEIVFALQSASNLTELHLRDAYCNGRLLDGLCTLQHLQKLTVWFSEMDVAFMDGLYHLRTTMIGHSTSEQRNNSVIINIERCNSTRFHNPDDDEWWGALLCASLHCDQLDVPFLDLPTELWEKFIADAQCTKSALQFAYRSAFLGGITDFTAYVTHHTALTWLDLEGSFEDDLPDTQLLQMVSSLPSLQSLVTQYHSATATRQGLLNSGAFAHLSRLTVRSSQRLNDDAASLMQQLRLIRDLVSLRVVRVYATVDEWQAVGWHDIRACTRHVRFLELHAEALQHTPRQQFADVASQVLLLPNLVQIGFSVEGRAMLSFTHPLDFPLTLRQLADIRRHAGFNSVQIVNC